MDYTVHGILQARILEWVAFPFPTGSSQPRDRTQVSDIAGGFFTSWATREAQIWQGQLKDLSYAYQNALRVFKSMICNKGSTRRESESRWVVSDSLWPHGLYIPWNSLGRNTGVGSLSLLQGIVPTQGSNPGFPNCRQILYQLSHKGSPHINLFNHLFNKCWFDCLMRGAVLGRGFCTNGSGVLSPTKTDTN